MVVSLNQFVSEMNCEKDKYALKTNSLRLSYSNICKGFSINCVGLYFRAQSFQQLEKFRHLLYSTLQGDCFAPLVLG